MGAKHNYLPCHGNRTQIDLKAIEKIGKQLLHLVGEDTGREGLVKTPARFARFWRDFVFNDNEFEFTTFDSEDQHEMVAQTHIPFYSICEHHMIPFFGYVTIAYIPEDSIVGLSKMSRVVDYFSHNLQNQERLTRQVGEFLDERLKPRGVAVTIEARHMCMEMRGIEKTGSVTTTTYLKGLFKDNADSRNEYLTYLTRNINV